MEEKMFAEEIKELKKRLKLRGNEFEEIKKEIRELQEKIEKLEDFMDLDKIKREDDIIDDEIKLSTLIRTVETRKNKNYIIKKAVAINLVNENTNLNIRSKDIIFSNKNKTTREWWFEPSLRKFRATFYIILNDEDKDKLYIFKIPKDTYLHPEEKFYYREDKGLCSIRIDGFDTLNFRDKLKSNICFKKFYTETLEYELNN